MQTNKKLYWQKDSTPAELYPLLRNLAIEYPLRESRGGGQSGWLQFERITEPGVLRIKAENKTTLIQYASLSLAARAIGCVLAGAVRKDRVYEEKTPFKTLGFMLDCSRYSVVTVEHFKKWLRSCALLGYNQAMLYTEDVYELPGEPYFGYMRGAYTEDELRAIDQYAAEMGVEMVACIQTLGHLNHALKWPAYSKIKLTSHTLRTAVPETYALIEKMIAHWARVFKSRRINLGMDESTDLKINQTKPVNELYFEHLQKVTAICDKHGLKPMIWSDMVFWVDTPERGLAQAYREDPVREPAKIRARLPKNLELACWHYSPQDPKLYVKYLEKHREIGYEPIMASGCQAWKRFWHDMNNMTAPRVAACIKACRQIKVRELLMTIWTGADGVDLDSAWAGLAFSAEHAFFEKPSQTLLKQRYKGIFHADYEASVAGALDIWWVGTNGLGAAPMLKDDPLSGLLLRALNARTLARIERQYQKQAQHLSRWRGEIVAGDMDYVRNLADFLGRKVGFFMRFQSAYRRKSSKDLRGLKKELKELRRSLEVVRKTFRRMWLKQFKPFGMEIVQKRLGGQAARYEEMAQRLDEFLIGQVKTIPEMDAPPVQLDIKILQRMLS